MITFLPCFELVLANFPAQPGHAYQEAAAATNHLLAGVKFPLSETEEHVAKENVESIALFPNIWFPVFGKNQEKIIHQGHIFTFSSYWQHGFVKGCSRLSNRK